MLTLDKSISARLLLAVQYSTTTNLHWLMQLCAQHQAVIFCSLTASI